MQQITVGTPVRVSVPDGRSEWGSAGRGYRAVVTAVTPLPAGTLLAVRSTFGTSPAMADWCIPRVMVGGLNPPRRRNVRAFYSRWPWFRASSDGSCGRADRALFALANERQRYVKRQTDADAYRAGERHLDIMEAAACRRLPGGF